MVIISAETFEELEGAARTGRVITMAQEGIDAIERGECHDTFEAVSSTRGTYGL